MKGKKRTMLIVISSIILFILLFLHFVVGWHHIPHHLRDLKDEFLSSSSSSDIHNGEVAAGADTISVDYATRAISEPLDTLMWGQQIRAGEFVPEGVKEEYNYIKSIDFSKLSPAEDVPTDEEAQFAIVRHYKQEVVNLLKSNDAHIRIGKGYNAPLQKRDDNEQEIARVTAMVSAFNTKGVNLGNIQMPLGIVYDFVKFASDPNTWYITDFSQTIPYDYELNKDRLD
ncbi:Uncharacterised protein [Sphingobacterium spiritivorum]|uniref:Uncharacterized protein n=1 Tax=Sphingobacterium spiritivorum TaxID=258 RepID=A0A380CVY8_SPHSI|nr:hypothetical protein [Sphingobacterium spiritivorum]SUJ29090.1 Uncharacterised protein [Sphingobacterium spiritivorum]